MIVKKHIFSSSEPMLQHPLFTWRDLSEWIHRQEISLRLSNWLHWRQMRNRYFTEWLIISYLKFSMLNVCDSKTSNLLMLSHINDLIFLELNILYFRACFYFVAALAIIDSRYGRVLVQFEIKEHS